MQTPNDRFPQERPFNVPKIRKSDLLLSAKSRPNQVANGGRSVRLDKLQHRGEGLFKLRVCETRVLAALQ